MTPNFSKPVLWPTTTEALKGLSIEDVRYLTKVGLQTTAESALMIPPRATTDGRCPPQHLAVAEDGPALICAGLNGVLAIEDDKIRTMNSSVVHLGEMLRIYAEYQAAVRGLSDDDADKLVTQTKQRMTQCDPAALADHESYWSVIVEQMEYGHL